MSKLTLPRIYETDIPVRLAEFLRSKEKIAIVFAKTGAGKTVGCARTIADVCKGYRDSGVKCTGSVLMPYRVSVKEMFNYLNALRDDFKEDHVYGYGISGDTQRSDKDHVVLQTVGYFLEGFIASISQNPDQLKLIMLDEAHDVSWQTDLVLSLLMWRIKKGDNIKLIISSATLDVQKIEKEHGIKTVNLIMDEETKRHIVHFNENENYNPLDGQKVSPDFYNILAQNVAAAYKATKQGHILVLMPGQDEIDRLITVLEKNQDIGDDAEFIPLHSQLSKADIQYAIDVPEKKGARKIIVATNIVENAITIDGLSGVVDSCLRKELFVDQDGINELRLTIASKSNIIQAYGRCGRQDAQGIAFVTVSQKLFDTLPQYSLSEIERNPLYPQLIKIFRHDLPYLELLAHVPRAKVSQDITYLEKHDMIVKVDGSYKLTKTSEIISQLPCGIRAGRLVVKSIEYIESLLKEKRIEKKQADMIRGQFYYYVCLTVAWIEHGTSVFENVFRRPRETDEAFQVRKEMANEKQAEFFRTDCFQTFLNVWFESSKCKKNLSDWCRENKIFYRAIVEIDKASKNIAFALMNIVHVSIPRMTRVIDFTPLAGLDLYRMMAMPMMGTFSDALFTYGGAPKRFGQKAEYIPVSFNGGAMSKFIIDRAVKSSVADGEPDTSHILALNIRRKGTMYFLSSIACVQISKAE